MRNLLLLAAVVIGFGSKAQTTPASGDRVGYANLPYIISQLPDVKQIETDLKSTQTQLRHQIEARTREVEQQYTEFNAAMRTMTDTVRISKQRELEQAMAELEQMQQDAQQTLQNKQKLFMAPLYLKVNRAIAEVAQENGFAIILTKDVGNYPFLFFHQEELNVSDLVLKKFGVTPATK